MDPPKDKTPGKKLESSSKTDKAKNKDKDALSSSKKKDSGSSVGRRIAGRKKDKKDDESPKVPDKIQTPQEMGVSFPVDESGIPKIPEMSWASLAWEVALQLGSALSGDLFSSGISVPCNMYEPLSILQRSIEFLEFSSCLDKACKMKSPFTRHAYVAGFALSPLPIAENRWKLDFNPILGETFEFVDSRGDSPVRCFAEQTSHHPPIAALHAENDNFRFYQNFAAVTNFLGNSLEVSTGSRSYVYLKATKEEFLILPPKIRVHNLIMGTMWMEYFGEMIVDNLTTGATCTLKFSKTGWLASGPNYEVTGYIKNKDGKKLIKMKGNWDTHLGMAPLEDNEDKKKGEAIYVWKRDKLDFTGKQFNLTPFAWSLNSFPADLQQFVLPSDSRRRPDRMALALGDVDTATAWKRVAEQQQRTEQKTRRGDKKEDPWQPQWFKLDKDHENLPFYTFNNKYWALREAQEALKEQGTFTTPDQIKNTACDFVHFKDNFGKNLEASSKKKGITVGDRTDQ